MPQITNHLLALDIGDKRVGVALASNETKIASPLITLNNDQDLIANIKKLIDEHEVETVVVGLPRSLSGSDTTQTTKVRELVVRLQKALDIKLVTQDEALSSVRAEEELRARGKIFAKMDVDQLAAALILEDYLMSIRGHE